MRARARARTSESGWAWATDLVVTLGIYTTYTVHLSPYRQNHSTGGGGEGVQLSAQFSAHVRGAREL